MEGSLVTQVERLQERTFTLLQQHCAAKDPSRFGRVVLLLPTVCSFASQDALERLLFPCNLKQDVKTTLSRILMYTSM